ncbi:hypothetical protein ACFLSQ_11430 [Bacteroidota bacterium]
MKSFIKYLVLYITTAFLFVSCSDKTLEPVANDSDLIPLAEGNKWVYNSYDYNDSSGTQITTFVHEILYKEAINQETWYFMNRDTNQTAYINRYNGLWFAWSLSKDNEKQLANYPLKLYDSVFYDIFTRTNENGQIIDSISIFKKITSLNSVITVPAGKFICVEIREISYNKDGMEDRYSQIVEYYKPGIGRIKVMYYDTDNEGNRTLVPMYELVEYKIQ